MVSPVRHIIIFFFHFAFGFFFVGPALSWVPRSNARAGQQLAIVRWRQHFQAKINTRQAIGMAASMAKLTAKREILNQSIHAPADWNGKVARIDRDFVGTTRVVCCWWASADTAADFTISKTVENWWIIKAKVEFLLLSSVRQEADWRFNLYVWRLYETVRPDWAQSVFAWSALTVSSPRVTNTKTRTTSQILQLLIV